MGRCQIRVIVALISTPSDVTDLPEDSFIDYRMPSKPMRFASFLGAVSLCVFAIALIASAGLVVIAVPAVAVVEHMM